MIATLLRVVGLDFKQLAREAAITIMLVLFGMFAAVLTLAFGFVALYLWLELKLGIFAALGVLGGTSAVFTIVLFAFAFWREPRGRAEGAFRAADPIQESAAAIAQAANEAVKGATETVRNGSRQQIVGTIAMAALVGWLLGRRS